MLALTPLALRTLLVATPVQSLPGDLRLYAVLAFLGTVATWGLVVEAARKDGARAWRGAAAALGGAVLVYASLWVPRSPAFPIRLGITQLVLLDALAYGGIALAIVTVVRARGVSPGVPLYAWAGLLTVAGASVQFAYVRLMQNAPPNAVLFVLPLLPTVLVTAVAVRGLARLGWPHRALTASAAVTGFVGAAAVAYLTAASRAGWLAGVDAQEWMGLAQNAAWGGLALAASHVLAAVALTLTPPAHSPSTRASPLEVQA